MKIDKVHIFWTSMLWYEAIQDESAELCFIIHNVHM